MLCNLQNNHKINISNTMLLQYLNTADDVSYYSVKGKIKIEIGNSIKFKGGGGNRDGGNQDQKLQTLIKNS